MKVKLTQYGNTTYRTEIALIQSGHMGDTAVPVVKKYLAVHVCHVLYRLQYRAAGLRAYSI